jgi:HAMP domain-containing protein
MTSEARLQIALERIYADPALTDPLRDPEAQELLNWAQRQVQCLVAETASLDDEAAWAWLNPRLGKLRRTVRRIAEESAKAETPSEAVRRRLCLLSALQKDTQKEDEHDEI